MQTYFRHPVASANGRGRRWQLNRIHRLFLVIGFGFLILATSSLHAQDAASDTHLYFFTNPGCAPCRQVEPAIDALKREGYPVTTLMANSNPEWSQRFGIDRTPTVVMIHQQKMVGRHAGLIDAVTLKKWFEAVGMPSGTAFQDKKGRPLPGGTKVVIDQPSTRKRDMVGTPDSVKTPTMHQGTTVARTGAEKRAMNATVLLRVEDDEGISYATGTVIHSQESEALVLTCGHVFRESAGRGIISAEFGFGSGQRASGSGELIDYDADARDIALVAIKTPYRIDPVKIANINESIRQNRRIFSIGCDHGEPPTIRHSSIKNKAAYDGAIKYDIFGRPVDGRSGGGLFTEDGHLIGVCNAAAVEVDEGIYAALDTVYWELQNTNLAHLFGQPNNLIKMASQGASAPNLEQANWDDANNPISPVNRAGLTRITPRRSAPVRTPVAWNRNQSESDKEVIIIVRSKSGLGPAETITIGDPTPKLLDYLDSMKTSQDSQRRQVEVANSRVLHSTTQNASPRKVYRGYFDN